MDRLSPQIIYFPFAYSFRPGQSYRWRTPSFGRWAYCDRRQVSLKINLFWIIQNQFLRKKLQFCLVTIDLTKNWHFQYWKLYISFLKYIEENMYFRSYRIRILYQKWFRIQNQFLRKKLQFCLVTRHNNENYRFLS